MSIPDILRDQANTFETKELEYGKAYLRHGNIMKALFPDGITLSTAEDFNRFAIFDLMVVKMNRYATSFAKEMGTHQDSLTDLGVYTAMLQELDYAVIMRGFKEGKS